MAKDAYTLSKFMIGLYGDDAERQARSYAVSTRAKGQDGDADVWHEAADIIAKRKNLVKTLDA